MNTDIVSEDESDDFTDEEEEQRKHEFEERQQQLQQSTPKIPRRASASDNHLYQSTRRQPSVGASQWYIDVPKNGYLEALTPQPSNGRSSERHTRLNNHSLPRTRREPIVESHESTVDLHGVIEYHRRRSSFNLR